MNSVSRLASTTLIALVLGTSLASAGGFGGTPKVGINDAVSDAVHHDTSGDIKDAVYDAVKPLNNQNVNNMLMPNQQQLALADGRLAIDCSVGGADLLVANIGDVAIPAGTKLKWTVKAEGAQGYVQLKQQLSAGADVRVAGALDDAASTDARCTIKAIGL